MITIVKVGGAILENNETRRNFLVQFSKIPGMKLLVHGGGRTSSKWMKLLGVQPKMIDGRRITDAQTLEIVTMVYSGINKQLVAELQPLDVNSLGLCGADGKLLEATRRPPKPIDYGFVGDINKTKVNIAFLQGLLKQNIVPIVAPLTMDSSGSLLNTNADTIASVLAQALQQTNSVRLLYVFEKAGLLRDANDDQTLLLQFSASDYEQSKSEGYIHSGMYPKLSNAFHAIHSGVEQVVLCNIENMITLKHCTKIIK